MKNKQMKSIFVIFVLALLSFERIQASRNFQDFVGKWTETCSDGKINFFAAIGVNETVLKYIKQHNPKTSINIKEKNNGNKIIMKFSDYSLETMDLQFDIRHRGSPNENVLINGEEVNEQTLCDGDKLSSRCNYDGIDEEYIEVRNLYQVNNSMLINYKYFSNPGVTYYAKYDRS